MKPGDVIENQDYLAPHKGDVAPDHDAWMKTEIENTLAKKQAGEMTCYSLDEAMQRFGFDARQAYRGRNS